ncbi:MAG: RDD family protein [Sphingomonadales bacterium]|jgi:uncharacterized RDD family membrane protein YckC
MADRQMPTPEGTSLTLAVPGYGERLGAFCVDMVLQFAVQLVFTIALALLAWSLGKDSAAWLLGFWFVASFVLQSFWFIGFESGRRGATPGKRWLGLRVASRDGRPLTMGAVVARNFARQLEVFVPLALVPAQFGDPDVGGWAALAALGWCGFFIIFPLFTPDRLRLGDLVAGTMVVRAPKPALAPDMSLADKRFDFTAEQLDAYGIYELQRLEYVLRDADQRGRSDGDAVEQVAAAIRNKIGWTRPDDDLALLAAYYAALKARLESRLVFGQRKADKFAK